MKLLDELALINEIVSIFGLDFKVTDSGQLSDKEIQSLIKERNECKKNKDYTRSDQIREELDKKGIILEDTKDGTTYRRKI